MKLLKDNILEIQAKLNNIKGQVNIIEYYVNVCEHVKAVDVKIMNDTINKVDALKEQAIQVLDQLIERLKEHGQ